MKDCSARNSQRRSPRNLTIGWFAPFLVIVGVSIPSIAAVGDQSAHESDRQPLPAQATWLDSVQIYSNVAIPLNKARWLGITVNGLWNGWGTESPVASLSPELIFWRFFGDCRYVDRIHKAGMRHGATLSCGFAHLQSFQERPELEKAVCRTLNGDFLKVRGAWSWYMGYPSWMCQNSPLWQEALLERAKRIVRAGSDAIVLDEPFGDTYFCSLPVPGFPGFSKMDLQLLSRDLEANFNANQRQAIFGLRETEPSDLREKLAQVEWEKWVAVREAVPATTPADLLWMRFKDIQKRSNFESKKRLVEAIREYSRQVRGEEIPIGANLAELEAASLGSHPLPVLYLAELCDFLAFEVAYRPPLCQRGFNPGGGGTFTLPPRGKWIPWHKLGVAIVGPHRSLALPSQKLTDWMAQNRRINYLCHLFAEAYAAQGALILDLKGGDYGREAEEKLRLYTQFVRQRADLFQNSQIVAPIGVLYSYSEETTARHFSYLGLAQALYESGLPFSVIYTASENTRWGTLSRSVLSQYKLLFVPIARALTPKQRESIVEYAQEDGGTVVLLGPDHGFSVPMRSGFYPCGAGGFVVMTIEGRDSTARAFDPGDAYHVTYSDEFREALAETALAHLPDGSPIVLPQDQRDWSVVGYSQPDSERAVIHVLNYDYDFDKDCFRPKRDLGLRVNASAFGLTQDGDYVCTAHSPERATSIDLAYVRAGSYLEIKIPELRVYEVLVLRSRERFSP